MGIAREGGRGSVRFFDHIERRASDAVCDRLYLCAGTLETVRILFEAGRDLSLPEGPLLRGLPESVSGRGPSVGALVRVPADGALRAVIAEMGIPPPDALPWPPPASRRR